MTTNVLLFMTACCTCNVQYFIPSTIIIVVNTELEIIIEFCDISFFNL